MAQWLAAIAALPKLLDTVSKLIQFFESRFGTDWDSKVQSMIKGYDDLEKAQTDEERVKALKSIIASRRN